MQKRVIGLRPRETNELPADKLLDILKGIYPEDIAQEIFQNLQKGEVKGKTYDCE